MNATTMCINKKNDKVCNAEMKITIKYDRMAKQKAYDYYTLIIFCFTLPFSIHRNNAL